MFSCPDEAIENLKALTSATGIGENHLTYCGTNNIHDFIRVLQLTQHAPESDEIVQDKAVQDAMNSFDVALKDFGYDAPSFEEPWKLAQWITGNPTVMEERSVDLAMDNLHAAAYEAFGRVSEKRLIEEFPTAAQGDNRAFAAWLEEDAPENNLTYGYDYWSPDPHFGDGFEAMVVHFDPPQDEQAVEGIGYMFRSYGYSWAAEDLKVARDEAGRVVMVQGAWDATKSRRFQKHGGSADMWGGELHEPEAMFQQLRHGSPVYIRGSRDGKYGPGEQIWDGPRDEQGNPAPQAVTVAFGYSVPRRRNREEYDPAAFDAELYEAVEEHYEAKRRKAAR